MAARVVIVGTGYAGTGVVQALHTAPSIDLTWISDTPYHLVKHEIHRLIRSPTVADKLTIPIDRMRTNGVSFREARMVGFEPEEKIITLTSGETIPYDYLVITVGAKPAYYGIPGMKKYAMSLAGVTDALEIHEALQHSFKSNETRVVIGGAGLTGVQVAGEVAGLAEESEANVEITLIEALDTILPNSPESLREKVYHALEAKEISVNTGSPIVEATPDSVIVDGDQTIPWDLLLWTGGITGIEMDGKDQLDQQRNRIHVAETLQSSDRHIFALGDGAFIDQPGRPAPPTAQAAWQAAPVAATNVQAAIDGKSLTPWKFENKGTVVSIGDSAFAHGIPGVGDRAIGSIPAQFLKKVIAARWIGGVSSWRHAASLWPTL